MGYKLIIAEKPSVARDIAKVLGVKERNQGYMAGKQYLVTWAIGHLVTLKEPDEMDERWKRWQAGDLPMLPAKMTHKVLPNTRAQFDVISSLMKRADVDSLICATDAGREGELIFRYIYGMADCQKPFERLWISSMTDDAIKKGFETLKAGTEYDALYNSARCRSEADWLIGMNATRAFTLRYGLLLSIGRVQTPTLQMLVKRRKEIDEFKPVVYYTLQANFGDYKGMYIDEKKERKITEKETAKRIEAEVKGQDAKVINVENEEKSEAPPLLYDLTSLQREASTQHGFSADKTLKLAQSLYETHKVITYPRTDSRHLSNDMMPSVKKALNALPSIASHFQALIEGLKGQPLPKTKRIFDDSKVTDHHAIIPTGKVIALSAFSADEGKLFDMIARKLIASFYPPHRYCATKIFTQCKEYTFLSNGTTVLQEGFKAVYKDIKEKKKSKKETEERTPLPVVRIDDARTVESTKVTEDKTKAPKEHTDASLLSAMEYAGRNIEDEALRSEIKSCSLGTPATRAAIIERIITVGYARRKGRQIIATKKGEFLMDAVPDEMASPEITGKWEQALIQIAEGKGDTERFMEGIKKLTIFLTGFAKNAKPVPFEREEGNGKTHPHSIGIPCPLCQQGDICENTQAFGCSRWREGCKFTLWKNAVVRMGGPELTQEIVKRLFQAENLTLRGKSGTLAYVQNRLIFEVNKRE